MALADLPTDFTPLEKDLAAAFPAKMHGGCRILRSDSGSEARFEIQPNAPCSRDPACWSGGPVCAVCRRENTATVIYDEIQNELRISAASLAERQEHCRLFGRHLFGDERRFGFCPKYTLDPLRRHGAARALMCHDVAGIKAVRLRELERSGGGPFHPIEVFRADDVSEELRLDSRILGQDICRVTLEILLESEEVPWTVTIMPGNELVYDRERPTAAMLRLVQRLLSVQYRLLALLSLPVGHCGAAVVPAECPSCRPARSPGLRGCGGWPRECCVARLILAPCRIDLHENDAVDLAIDSKPIEHDIIDRVHKWPNVTRVVVELVKERRESFKQVPQQGGARALYRLTAGLG
ncbi:MAG TPA: hypothetical protein VKX45_03450 [Bryobacteraceae bacterium]|nr:hypothetical protein [Bryobacteraceae bacterium]